MQTRPEGQTYRCQDCGNTYPEDEVDILRRSPVDKGYLACTDCIASYRARVSKEEPTYQWIDQRLRQAEYKAQDFEVENGIHGHDFERPTPARTFWQWFVAEFRYFFLSYE